MLFHAINFKAQHECCLFSHLAENWRCITWNWICEWFISRIIDNYTILHHAHKLEVRHTVTSNSFLRVLNSQNQIRISHTQNIHWFNSLIRSLDLLDVFFFSSHLLRFHSGNLFGTTRFFWFSSGLNVLLALVCVCRTSFSINTEIYRFFSSLCTVKLGL